MRDLLEQIYLPWRPLMMQLELPWPDEPEGTASDAEFLTIAEAARELRICERTVRRAIEAGDLRAARVGGTRGSRGAFRIRRSDLDRWVYDGGS